MFSFYKLFTYYDKLSIFATNPLRSVENEFIYYSRVLLLLFYNEIKLSFVSLIYFSSVSIVYYFNANSCSYYYTN